MNIEIKNKFNIGDKVKKQKIIGTYKDKIICPLCNGKHKVNNPNYNKHQNDEETLICEHCDENGYISTNYTVEKIIENDIYCIDSIHITVKNDNTIKYTYGLQTNPEISKSTTFYASCSAFEHDLIPVKNE